jgi:hypothetical protein
MIMPGLDNLDPYSPSEFFTGNMTTTAASPEMSPSPRTTANMNFINSGGNPGMTSPHPHSIPSGASVTYSSPNTDYIDNLNVNTKMGGVMNVNMLNQQQQQQQQQQQMQNPMLSPNSIKQEPLDTSQIKSEPDNEPPACSVLSPDSDPFVTQNRLTDVDKVLAEAQMTPEHSRLLLLNQVTDIIVEAHMGTTVNTHDNVAAAKERIAGCKMDKDDMMVSSSVGVTSLLCVQFLT